MTVAATPAGGLGPARTEKPCAASVTITRYTPSIGGSTPAAWWFSDGSMHRMPRIGCKEIGLVGPAARVRWMLYGSMRSVVFLIKYLVWETVQGNAFGSKIGSESRSRPFAGRQ